jgi:hypothetical protein
MLFRETVAVYCENHVCGQNAEFNILKKVVHIVTTGIYRAKIVMRV